MITRKVYERCPTAAWDMQKFWYNITKAGEVKYGANDSGSMVQIIKNGDSSNVRVPAMMRAEGVFMRNLTLVLGLLLMTSAVHAQWQSEDIKVVDTPDRKSVNGFGVHLLAVKDPRSFIQEWLKPQQPKINPAKKIKAGEPLGIIVLFAGCKEASGKCDSEVDYTVYRPDGSIFVERLKQPLWKEVPPPKSNIQLGRAILSFQFQKGQPAGPYKIRAQVRDINANTTVDLETQIELKD